MDLSLSCNPEHDLCMYGRCQAISLSTSNNTYYYTCTCDEGYRLDQSWFHQQTCTDSTIGATIHYSLFIALLIPAQAFLFMVTYSLKRNSGAQTIGIVTFLGCCSSGCSATSMYIQAGCQTACAIFTIPCFVFDSFTTIRIVTLCFAPLTLMSSSATRRMFAMGEKIWISCVPPIFIATGLAMTSTAAFDNVTNYNKAAFTHFTTLWILGAFVFIVIIMVATRLSATIFSISSSEMSGGGGGGIRDNRNRMSRNGTVMRNMMRRLWILKIFSLIILIPFLVLVIAVPLAIQTYGVLPYFNIVVYVLYWVSGPFFACGVALFLRISRQEYEDAALLHRSKSEDPGDSRALATGTQS